MSLRSARNWIALELGVALVLLFAAGSARAGTLPFTGTLTLQVRAWPAFVMAGSGLAQVTDDGALHLLSLSLAGGTFGPFTTSVPVTADITVQSVRATGIQNLGGLFTQVSGGPPGGGVMPLQGMARVCFAFDLSCVNVLMPFPFTATGTPLRGFGVGGTQQGLGGPNVGLTYQHAPWTIGQPVITIHRPGSNVTTPMLPGGFAHGPASATSSTAQASGALQLVTATRVFTSLTGAFPEFPVTGVVTLHFVPEPGTLVLLVSGGVVLTLAGRRRARREPGAARSPSARGRIGRRGTGLRRGAARARGAQRES